MPAARLLLRGALFSDPVRHLQQLWPTDAIPGEAAQLLPLPRHSAQQVEGVLWPALPLRHHDALGLLDHR
jgi:hypothetical protein